MSLLNLGWLALGLLACQVCRVSDTDSDVGVLLFEATVLISLLSLGTRGLWPTLAVLPLGLVGLCFLHSCGRQELVSIPVFLGLLLAVYNLGGRNPLTVGIALGQLLILAAPAVALAVHGLWWALPAGLGGLTLASLAALPYAWRCR